MSLSTLVKAVTDLDWILRAYVLVRVQRTRTNNKASESSSVEPALVLYLYFELREK